jgi:Prokaryotic E2 family E
MTGRVLDELGLLRACWPALEFVEAGLWVRLANYPLPRGIWDRGTCEVAFQIPTQLPGQAPYGFYVRPGLELAGGGAIGNYTFPTLEPPFDSSPWGKFSWALAEWQPAAEAGKGSNMVQFARSIADRLREGA